MDRLFHIPSLMLCLSAAFVIVSIFLTLLWMSDRSNKALVCWTAGFWVACIGLFLLALRDVIPDLLSLGMGNSLSIWALGLVWLGCLEFDQRRVAGAVPIAFFGGGVWLALFAFWPEFSNNLSARVLFASVLYAAYSLMVALVVHQGHSTEPLPARRFAIFAFGLHGLFYLVRLVLIAIDQPTIQDGHATIWYGALLFEYFIQALFAALAIFSMVHERMSLNYKRASEVDFLTGLQNRRAFLDAVCRDRQKSGGSAPGAVMALIDADHFKQINDNHGHGAGDAALRMLAEELVSKLPVGAQCGRLGGEEFGIYLTASIANDRVQILETLLECVRRKSLGFEGRHFHLTVSIGAAILPEGDLDFNLALAAADRALYVSKKAGRDRLTAVEYEAPAIQKGGHRVEPVSTALEALTP
ncbi:GGDEF domain-containing protein [Rhizobium sp. G187]|uniref:GGDEF domain-containing protein n=1 Tax=Rhizobium sp. G187 TaxID=3451352 RepID=UPI003EE657B0